MLSRVFQRVQWGMHSAQPTRELWGSGGERTALARAVPPEAGDLGHLGKALGGRI